MKVLIVDDLLATGGTMLASINLVEQMKGEIIGIDVVDHVILGNDCCYSMREQGDI